MMTSIDTFGDFFEVTFNTILNTTRKAYYKSKDIHRTVSIYVDYVDTTDFDLEEEDKKFLIKQGVIGALTYLEELVERKKAGTLSPDFDEIVIERSAPLEIVNIGGISLLEKGEEKKKDGETAGEGSRAPRPDSIDPNLEHPPIQKFTVTEGPALSPTDTMAYIAEKFDDGV